MNEGLKHEAMQGKDNRLRPAVIRRYLPDAWTSPFVYIKEREAENERESILQNHNGSRICINCMQLHTTIGFCFLLAYSWHAVSSLHLSKSDTTLSCLGLNFVLMKKTVFQLAEMEGQHAVCTF